MESYVTLFTEQQESLIHSSGAGLVLIRRRRSRQEGTERRQASGEHTRGSGAAGSL